MRIIKLTKTSLDKVVSQTVKVLRAGGLVIYPTETVYGLGVDATNLAAVKKLIAYKTRREGKPLSIAVTNQIMASQYVELTDQAKKFYEKFLPGPYTIISKGRGQVATGVESEFGTLGIRIPDYQLVTKLVEQLDRPITATSANASGEKRPYKIADVLDHLSAKQTALIDLIIDAGTLPKNEPSIVIDTTLSTPLAVRGQWAEQTKLSFETHSDQETRDLAGKLLLKHWGEIKEKGLLIALNGELGAGKTVFTQGVARFLKISQSLVSPTYIYLNEYTYDRHGLRGKLFHLDAWKIDSAEELARLKVGSLLKPKHVVVVEWWQQVSSWWPSSQRPDLLINFTEIDEQSRKISVKEKTND